METVKSLSIYDIYAVERRGNKNPRAYQAAALPYFYIFLLKR